MRYFKRIVRQIHLWLGLLSGLVVLILGITGCIYAFQEELQSWLYADKLYVTPADTPRKPLEEGLAAAQATLGKEMPIQRTVVPNGPEYSYIFYHFALHENPQGPWYWNERKYNLAVYVNPYTAKVIGVQDMNFEFFSVVLWLHWSLLLKNSIGQPIVGVATLMFVVLLISGLVLWWPHNKKARKMRTWFRWKPDTRWKRKNYDLHNILGFYSLFLVIFIALTGLMWAFDWFSSGVEWVANGGEPTEQSVPALSDSTQIASAGPLAAIHQSLQESYPQAKQFYISFPPDKKGAYSVSVDAGNLIRTEDDYLYFDQYTAREITRETWADKSGGDKVHALKYDIHVGAIGGLPGKVIAFFLSLFAASLPVTGFIMWYFRKLRVKSV